jgi:UDP-N-acetylmuramoyl-L-alanyl-D-glutamate--2,6-diaminopimelate ligase
MAAASVAKQLGIPDATIVRALREFRGVPGRMEFVERGPYTAVVDYAHTPDSLEAAYKALRARLVNKKSGKLVCVLGAAGGGRDRWKRPEMGKIAATYCDEIILTDEDSYDEKPEEILSEIEAGFPQIADRKSQAVHHRILDRREAIKKAVSLMRSGDIVIGTGKGSEDSIHLAHGRKIPWNERNVFEEALEEKLKKG